MDHLGHGLVLVLVVCLVVGDMDWKWGLLKSEGNWMVMHIERVEMLGFWSVRVIRVLKECERGVTWKGEGRRCKRKKKKKGVYGR